MAATATKQDPATNAELLKELKELRGKMEEKSKPTTKAQALFVNDANGFGGHHSWRDERLMKRLDVLSKSYNDEIVVNTLMRDHKGRPRGIGIGPSLVKMAALCHPSLRQYVQGGVSDSYGPENFEAEHGFTTLSKAKHVGIKGLNGEVRKTALAEASGVTGGYIVPPQFMNELLTIAAEDSFIEPRAKVVPMNTRTVTWPMLDITTVQASGTTPYFGGILAQWQPEAATINESEPTFRQSEWTAWDLVLYTVASNQLLQDNGVNLDALLTQLFAQAVTWYKEYAFLQGKGAGSSMPLGIINAPATYVQNRGTPNAFKLADAAAMLSHLQIRSWEDACWIMHQSVIPQLIQMVDNSSSNRLVWMNPVMPGQEGPAASKLPQAFLNGLPIYFTEKVPSLGNKGDVMLVDWSRYVIGNRLDLQIDVSDQFLFRTNQLAWRVVARCDGRPWLNNSITDAEGWVISPFVVLN